MNFEAALQPLAATEFERASVSIRAHTICADNLRQTRVNTVDTLDIPKLTPIIWDGKAFGPLFVITVQYNKLCLAPTSNWRANSQYLAPPVTIGLKWGKPYCHFIPITNTTPANWHDLYPPFHYGDEHGICVGKQFAIGDATNVADQLPQLIELLSWVNMTDPTQRLSAIALEHPGSLWEQWHVASQAAANKRPQDIFTAIPTFQL